MKKQYSLILLFFIIANSVFSQKNINQLNLIELEILLQKKNPSLLDELLTNYDFVLVERYYWDDEETIIPWDHYYYAYKYNPDRKTAMIWIDFSLKDINGSRKKIKNNLNWKNDPFWVSIDNSITITCYDDDFYNRLTLFIKNNYKKTNSKYFNDIKAFMNYYSNGLFKIAFFKNTEKSQIAIEFYDIEDVIFQDSLKKEIQKDSIN